MNNAMSKKEYKRVDCSLYDRYEALAVQNKLVNIRFRTGSERVDLQAVKIKTLETRDKEEFMILESGERFRLDEILSLVESS